MLADPVAHATSFGQDPALADTIREAWNVDLNDWMASSAFTPAAPTVLFSLAFRLVDPEAGEYPVRLFAQSVTQDHAALLYHQPSAQLTPMVAGILSSGAVLRSAALRLSQMTSTVVPMNVLDEVETDLPIEEIARLAFASSRQHLPHVLDAAAGGMLLLLRGELPV